MRVASNDMTVRLISISSILQALSKSSGTAHSETQLEKNSTEMAMMDRQ